MPGSVRVPLVIALLLAGSAVAGCKPAGQAPGPAPATPPLGASSAAGPGIRLCADFGLFPDDTPLPPTFRLAGFEFNNAATPSAWIVNQEGYEKGLRLQDQGAEIWPPVVVDSLELTLGAFASEVTIEAEDAKGVVLQSLKVPGKTPFADYRLTARGIAAVTIKGGGGEASIKSLCVGIPGQKAGPA